ncbi:MAG: ATP-grasp domain-containing protein [Methylovulum sp.]|uniref:ATP-grasp domain-containing protein n=1 Tax=Methylovulum sp. TaxID=1916980 RepID=UPI0026145629|nr:ATP-grasp domain-containing protein [Methylovulum sp.]MDD2724397.1 ATP-grasp domain-containing protein [Methylovulum sp.]MDD5124018.1 ATP-grasp domain-containing protein [Methylovulum sp.]
MRIWFNKTFSTISAVFNNLHLAGRPGEVTIICTHTHNTASAFLAADEYYLEPSLIDEAYLLWCLDFCLSHRIGLFWPGKEAALISKHHERFQAIGVQVLSVADYNTLSLLDNKAGFYAALNPEIAPTMDFIAVDNLDAFDRAVMELSTRHESLCVKPSVSVFGLGFRILDTQRDSITHLAKGVEYQIPLSELRLGMFNTRHFETMLVMEHLGGHEWSVDCAGRHGELLCAVQRKKPLLKGHGQEIDNNADIQGMVERLSRHYRLNGLFNIQFKEGKYGPKLLEINPRPSGGFGMACLAGVNLAKVALQAIKGEKVIVPSIDYGLRVTEVGMPVVLRNVG